MLATSFTSTFPFPRSLTRPVRGYLIMSLISIRKFSKSSSLSAFTIWRWTRSFVSLSTATRTTSFLPDMLTGFPSIPKIPDQEGFNFKSVSMGSLQSFPASLTQFKTMLRDTPILLAMVRSDVLSSTYLLTVSFLNSLVYRDRLFLLKLKYLLQSLQKYLCVFSLRCPDKDLEILIMNPIFFVLRLKQLGQRFFCHHNPFTSFDFHNVQIIHCLQDFKFKIDSLNLTLSNFEF